MTKDEALNLALEFIEQINKYGWKYKFEAQMYEAITAIKEALAQPEQEPVAWEQFHEHMAGPFYKAPPQPEKEPVAWGVFEGNLHDMFFSPSEAQEMADLKGTHAEVRPLYTTPPVLAQPEQESFEYWNAVEGWVKIDEVRKHFDSVGCGTIYKTAGEDRTPLYTTPQRTWVGLTAKEKHEIRYSHMTSAEFIEVIEAKLKERNT